MKDSSLHFELLPNAVAVCYFYICQLANGVKVTDILFSLLCVCLSVCVSVRTQSSIEQCVSLAQCISHLPHATHLPPPTHVHPKPIFLHLADICTL